MKKIIGLVLLVFVCLCCAGLGAGGFLGYRWSTAKPSLTTEMHKVTWSQRDLTSWQTKNAKFRNDIDDARRAGQRRDVQLVITEEESTAIAAQTLDDIMKDEAPNGLKRQVIDATGGMVTGVSDVQVNYIDGKALVSAVVKVRGLDMTVAAKQHTEIVNGRPRKVIDLFQAGAIPIPDQAKSWVQDTFGPGGESFTFELGNKSYTVGNVSISGDSAAADYQIKGISENLELKQVSMQGGKLVMSGTTK